MPCRAEVRCNRRGVLRDEAYPHHSRQRENLRRGKHVLNQRTQLHAERIEHREHGDNQKCHQVGRIQPHRTGTHMPDPMRGSNAGKEHTKKLPKPHRDRRRRSRLNHKEQRPPVQKSPDRPQRFAQVHILTPGLWHHRRKFSVAQRADQSHHRRHHPSRDQQRRRSESPAHIRRNQENPRPHH